MRVTVWNFFLTPSPQIETSHALPSPKFEIHWHLPNLNPTSLHPIDYQAAYPFPVQIKI